MRKPRIEIRGLCVLQKVKVMTDWFCSNLSKIKFTNKVFDIVKILFFYTDFTFIMSYIKNYIAHEGPTVPPLHSYRARFLTIRLSFLLATKLGS